MKSEMKQFLFILVLLILIFLVLSGMINSFVIKNQNVKKQFCQEKGMVYGVGEMGLLFGACYKIQNDVVVEVKDIIKLNGKYYLK